MTTNDILETNLLPNVLPHVIEVVHRDSATNQTIVEIGCGGKQYNGSLLGNHIGTDRFVTANYQGPGPDVCCDGAKLPFPDDAVDIIFMVGVLCVIGAANCVLVECFRVLKPEGKLLVFDYSLRTTRELKKRSESLGYQGHQEWSHRGLAKRIHNSGFVARSVWDFERPTKKIILKSLMKYKWFRFALFFKEMVGQGWNIVRAEKPK